MAVLARPPPPSAARAQPRAAGAADRPRVRPWLYSIAATLLVTGRSQASSTTGCSTAWQPQGVLAAQLAVTVTSLGDSAPLLTILVVSGVLAPVRWGGGWRLLLLHVGGDHPRLPLRLSHQDAMA